MMTTTTNRTIDLNADLGEGMPWDEALLDRVTSANVCCGAHAGDPRSIETACRIAQSRGVAIGAHPGYPDRPHFGRAEREATETEVYQWIVGQVADLQRLVPPGSKIRHLKPHGALYNQAQRDPTIARAAVRAARDLRLPIFGMPGGEVERCCQELGARFIAEGFADRRYLPDGRLAPRSHPDAVLTDPDEMERQLARLLDQGVQTVCVHGDHEGSVVLADRLLAWLRGWGAEVRSFIASPSS